MIGQETLLELRWRQLGSAADAPSALPCTTQRLARCWPKAPLSPAADVAKAVEAAHRRRCRAWRRTPAGDRIQPLFRLKALLDAQLHARSRA